MIPGVVGFVAQTGTSGSTTPVAIFPGWRFTGKSRIDSEFHSESLLAAPLVQGGRTIGVLEAAHSRGDFRRPTTCPCSTRRRSGRLSPSQRPAPRADAAIARAGALLEERARLARELHDAVAQSLYSMTILAGPGGGKSESGQLAPQRDRHRRVGRDGSRTRCARSGC